jgi:histidine kinase/DNA gyrase B/HSP90-like ATPase
VATTKRGKPAYTNVSAKFTLRDIGSSFIDQVSSDIYTEPAQIIREIVKNAYDSYQGRDEEFAEDERVIIVSRHREPNGTGHLLISDRGHGQDLETLRKNVQISISNKPETAEDATGFRGLGSWSLLGGGSRVVITSKVAGATVMNRLTINVRAIYNKIKPTTTLDDILNDERCIALSQSTNVERKTEHFTTVDIEIDGKSQKVRGYEINRLYDFTDEREQQLLTLLYTHCAVPYNFERGANAVIKKVCVAGGYVPTQIFLDGTRLVRRVPQGVTIHTEDLKVGTKVIAKAWYAEAPGKTGALPIPSEPEVSSPGIQLMKFNVPIGQKNLYSNSSPNPQEGDTKLPPSALGNLNWYVGEVHITAKDVQPSANGNELRASEARDAFLSELRAFYFSIYQQTRDKSALVSAKKHLDNVIAVESNEKASEATRATAIAAARRYLDDKKGKGDLIAADPAFEELLKKATRAVKRLEARAKPAPTKRATKPARRPVARTKGHPQKSHRYLAPVIPQLGQLGLRRSHHERVVEIASEIAVGLSKIDDLDLDEAQRTGVLLALAQMFTDN